MKGSRVARSWIGLAVAASLGLFLIGCQRDSKPDAQAVFEQARDLINDGKYEEGLAKMRALVDANPGDPDIQLKYGQTLMASGQPSLAVWPLSRAIDDPAYLVEAGLLLARAQTEAGSGIDAIKTATRILETEPNNEDALLARAEASLRENLEERALEDLERAEELGADEARIDVLRLDALLGLGREKEAEALLTELAERADELRSENPADAARLCAAIATFTFERGDVEGAKKRFEDCLEEHGMDNAILVQAAIQFFDEHGEADRATKIYRERFEKNEDRLDLRVDYADRLQKMGKAKEGEELLLAVTEKQKGVWLALVDFYGMAGDVPKALNALEQAIAASPVEREDWRFTRADFLLELGQIDRAEEALADIDVPAHRALIEARIALSRGDLDRAIERFEEGIRLWPDNPDARYLAAFAYERKGDWTKAASHYREAARMERPHYLSSLALAGLQRDLGDMEGVQFLLLRLADQRPNDPLVAEKLIQYAADTGSGELGMRMLNYLARMRGQAPHAVALAAARVDQIEGPEAALAAIDKSGLDFLEPAHVEALEARTRLLLELDRDDDALADLEKARGRTKDSARLLVLRATVRRARGETELARTDLEQALALDGKDVPALLELASLEVEAGQKDRAVKHYAEAIPLESAAAKPEQPNQGKATLALARLEIDAGDREAARKRLRALLDENPRQGEAAWLILQTYAEGTDSGLDAAARRDLALRASVFFRSPAAVDYWKKLNASAP
ncbi:MAG: tetratricopeptide repeat protein [Myxococcota bacterium]